MIFITLGTSKFQFNRLLESIYSLKIKEKIIIQTCAKTLKVNGVVYLSQITHQEFIKYLKEARVVITHSTPATFYQCLKYSKNLPLVIPRNPQFNEHTDPHQIEFAKSIYSRYKHNVIINDDSFTPKIHQYILRPIKSTKKHHIACSPSLIKNLRSYIENIFPRKTAIVAETIMKYGGAERVIDELLTMFPTATLYCLFITPSARQSINHNHPKIEIHASPFQLLVRSDQVIKYISVIKLVSWIYWETINLKSFSQIISISCSYGSKNIKRTGGAPHLSYVLTPPRFLYHEFSELNFVKKFPFSLLLHPLRIIDRIGIDRPTKIIAISKEVSSRIKKYYHKDALIIHPPVITCPYKKSTPKRNHYVVFSRLYKQKGIELAVNTCSQHQLPLTVVGNGPELGYLKRIAGPTIKFITRCPEAKKWQLLKEAKALIYTSKEEDFGIVPVEAMSVGTPVIGFASGGVTETVINQKTGVLFDQFSSSGLILAIRQFEKLKITPRACIVQSKKFDQKIFRKKILSLVNISHQI